jgi:predicted DNA-binding protein (MmcQ/YjbR family)
VVIALFLDEITGAGRGRGVGISLFLVYFRVKIKNMNDDFIQVHCLSKKGAEEDYQAEWDAIRYTVGRKIFAMVSNDAEGWAVISVKHTPEQGREWREKYDEITPAFHLNKESWSSTRLAGRLPESVLKQMLDDSYDLVLESLSKRIRDDVLGA